MFSRFHLLLLSLGWIPLILLSCTRQAPEHEVILTHGELIDLPVVIIEGSQVRFFTYKWKGRNINFFLRRDRNGGLQAHFDACYSCFQYKLGYIHEGNKVVCIACRIGFDLDEPVWEFVGPCVPIHLRCEIKGEHVSIRVTTLQKGLQFF